jgi:nucleoside-diphosphate-sugar epimerase
VHAAWVTTDAATLGITPADHVALNLRPLLTVLQYAARTGPGAFVYVSSSGVFAPDDATEGLTETHRPTGGSPYAAAKRAGELLVTAALDPGTAVHVVRLGYLFGPGEVGRPSRSRVSLIAGWLAAAREGQAASQVPGAETLTESAVGRIKPPMVPSDIPSLRGFRWTDPTAGVRALLAAEVAT